MKRNLHYITMFVTIFMQLVERRILCITTKTPNNRFSLVHFCDYNRAPPENVPEITATVTTEANVVGAGVGVEDKLSSTVKNPSWPIKSSDKVA